MTILLAGNHTIYEPHTLLCDASAGPINLFLDTMPVGSRVQVKKIDGTSQCVTVYAVGGAVLDPHFPDERAYVPLEGDFAEFYFENGIWWLMAPGVAALRHVQPVAEHTIVHPFYMIDPSYNGYIMLCDPEHAIGGAQPIMIVLPLLRYAAKNHQTFSVDVMKFDATPFQVSVCSQVDPITGVGDTIHANNAVKLPTTNYQLDIYMSKTVLPFWTDGARWIVR